MATDVANGSVDRDKGSKHKDAFSRNTKIRLELRAPREGARDSRGCSVGEGGGTRARHPYFGDGICDRELGRSFEQLYMGERGASLCGLRGEPVPGMPALRRAGSTPSRPIE